MTVMGRENTTPIDRSSLFQNFVQIDISIRAKRGRLLVRLNHLAVEANCLLPIENVRYVVNTAVLYKAPQASPFGSPISERDKEL